jgi:iron complex outermembrane receptor protein
VGELRAQDPGSILGRITDVATGAPLPEALVSVSGTGRQILSGENGWYFLTGVPAGVHEITVGLLGYALVRDTVELVPGDALSADYQLTAEPIPVDELVISVEADPLRNLSQRRVILREELERRQATTMAQLLQGLVPELTQTFTSGEVGAAPQIRIRGVRSLRPNPPIFIVDGVRIVSAQTGGPPGTGSILAFLDVINPRDVDRIEILHASEATTFYGTDAAGGAILIFTRRR